jgi:two-component system chemotaxis sensor kinase CheA
MLILTDVTDERRLESEVERERRRLAAWCRGQGSPGFLPGAGRLRRLPGPVGTVAEESGEAPEAALRRLYRRAHTFKGLFLLFECRHVAEALHDMESRAGGPGPGGPDFPRRAARGVRGDAARAGLDEDLRLVRQTLGEDFFKRRGEVRIDEGLARDLEEMANGLLASLPAPDPRVRRLLERARTLRHVDIKSMLGVSLGTASGLAERLGKKVIAPPVAGPVVTVDPDRFGPLARRMVHLVRNAVAHGIETPEPPGRGQARGRDDHHDRVHGGRGRGHRRVRRRGGIDSGAVRRRAAELGLAGRKGVGAMDDGEVARLIVAQGLSTSGEASEASDAAWGCRGSRGGQAPWRGAFHRNPARTGNDLHRPRAVVSNDHPKEQP